MDTDDTADDRVLRIIDSALLRMRRLWLSPASHAQMERDVGGGIPLSVVLVVDAVHRGPPDDAHPAGRAPAEVTVADVATRLQVNPSTASRLVEGAYGAGYVERRRSAVDARRSVLHLTPAGRDLLTRAGDFRRSHLERLLADFSPDQRRAFAALLDRFADAVADLEAE